MLDQTELQQLIQLYPVLGQLSPAARSAVQADAQRFAFPQGASCSRWRAAVPLNPLNGAEFLP